MSIGRGRLGTVYLRLEREKSTIAEAPVDSRIVLPGVRVSQQRYDSLLRPTRGHHYTFDIRGTHEDIGSNNRFFQMVGEGSILVPLPWRLSVYSRGKIGATFQNAPAETLPVSYRFFAGGDRSVRGYGYQQLGPADAFGRVVGGRNTIVASIELNRALLTNWGAAAFYDTGNAFNSFGDYHLFRGAGIGIRYYTVVGALRLDAARQIGVINPSYRFHFTVGFAF
jgi:translocation and assembly module TamA